MSYSTYSTEGYAPNAPTSNRTVLSFVIGVAAGAAALFLLTGSQSNTQLYATGTATRPVLQRGLSAVPTNSVPTSTFQAFNQPAPYAGPAFAAQAEAGVQFNSYTTVQPTSQATSLGALLMVALGALGGAVIGHNFFKTQQAASLQPIAMMATTAESGMYLRVSCGARDMHGSVLVFLVGNRLAYSVCRNFSHDAVSPIILRPKVSFACSLLHRMYHARCIFGCFNLSRIRFFSEARFREVMFRCFPG